MDVRLPLLLAMVWYTRQEPLAHLVEVTLVGMAAAAGAGGSKLNNKTVVSQKANIGNHSLTFHSQTLH